MRFAFRRRRASRSSQAAQSQAQTISTTMEAMDQHRYLRHTFPQNSGPSEEQFFSLISGPCHNIKQMLLASLDDSGSGTGKGVYSSRNLGLLYALFLLRDPDFQTLFIALRSTTRETHAGTFLSSTMLLPVVDGEAHQLTGYASSSSALPASECELLYGRAGCLFGLLLAQKLHPQITLDTSVRSLVNEIIHAGYVNVTEEAVCVPIFMWSWKSKQYLGAIHGVAGILFVLLEVPHEVLLAIDSRVMQRIKATIAHILTTYTLPSGNIASATGSTSDRLVHFCHGATGWIPLLCKCHALWGTTDSVPYLEHALRLGNVVWQRGLLITKGPGICHGISGSICALMDLNSTTQDVMWLHRARWFALFLSEHWESLATKADLPYSLFEGLIGAYYALQIVQSPESQQRSSWFPGLGL